MNFLISKKIKKVTKNVWGNITLVHLHTHPSTKTFNYEVFVESAQSKSGSIKKIPMDVIEQSFPVW